MTQPYFDEAIEAATQCAKECDMCIVDCVRNNDVARLRECILSCLDCADLCRTAISLMSRTSEHSREFLEFSREAINQCRDICKKCKDVPTCVTCSQACEHLSSLSRRLEKSFVPGFTQ